MKTEKEVFKKHAMLSKLDGVIAIESEVDEAIQDPEIQFVFDAMTEFANQSKWIPVGKEMPKSRRRVLISWIENDKTQIASGSFHDEGKLKYWASGGATQMKVTHWQPLPEKPKNLPEDIKGNGGSC